MHIAIYAYVKLSYIRSQIWNCDLALEEANPSCPTLSLRKARPSSRPVTYIVIQEMLGKQPQYSGLAEVRQFQLNFNNHMESLKSQKKVIDSEPAPDSTVWSHRTEKGSQE